MRNKRKNSNRRGVALLVVLFVVMAITILSVSFIAQSDMELSVGKNMVLRTEMDYLAESGLEHARGLILNPQDVSSAYWTGAVSQQLVAGSDDYYDVSVTKLGECNYRINSEAYRKKAGVKVGRSRFSSELRLDPVIAFWSQTAMTISPETVINGDVYSDAALTILGIVNGDVFVSGAIADSGTVLGQKNANVVSAPISLPGLSCSDFSSYYYIGSSQYSVGIIDTADLNDVTLGPTAGNPAGIYYRDPDLMLYGNINITGMLVVKHDLKLEEGCNMTITAVKNFPALLVGHDIKIQNDNQSLNITGIAQVGHRIEMGDKIGNSINILGALYILGDGIKNTSGCSVNITAVPNKAAIEIWPGPGTAQRWSPAAGAFFRSIQRQ